MMLPLLLCLLLVSNNAQQINVVQTAKDTKDRLTPKDPIQWETNFPSPITVMINSTLRFQSVLGFGGAFTESSGFVWSSLKPSLQQRVLQAYWGLDGIGFTLGRIPMNSCDFALSSYSADDKADDFLISNFTIARDEQWLIPLVKAAMNTSKVPITLFLTPWSPPAWMKINGNMDGSAYPLGLNQTANVSMAWALFFSKFISAYKGQGINFWGLTVQNEPEYGANKTITPYEGCIYTAEAERDFVKYYLGPQISKDHPEVKIMIYDHNKDRIKDVAIWAKTILSDPVAAKYVAGTAFHWYTGSEFENLALAHEVDPSKFLLASEQSLPAPSFGNWSRGEEVAYDIIGDLNNWAVGWTYWSGPSHVENWCDAPIIANVLRQELIFNPFYYYLGQFSKFLLPNSTRLNSTCNGGLYCTAFLTPENNVALVVMNQGDESVTFKLDMDNNQYAKVPLPPHSIATYSWQYKSF